MAPAGRRSTGGRMSTPPPQQEPATASSFEPIPSRSSKTRLNLLNPMSLLARRRASQQAIAQLPKVPASPVLYTSPITFSRKSFDPSIRGTKVHDFDNAPRARRNVSQNDVGSPDISGSQGFLRSPNTQQWELSLSAGEPQLSPWSGGQHTPVFTEDFEEEQYPAAGPHVRKASDLSDLHVPRPPFAARSRPQSSPAPTEVRQDLAAREISSSPARANSVERISVSPKALSLQAEDQGYTSGKPKSISIDATPLPKTSPSSIKTRSRNVSGASTKEFLLNGNTKPKHMKSTSSRFSFDMIGAANQEKLLEDRHRQKELEKKASSPLEDNGEFDNFDYDGMLDDDLLEERIPGVNADAEDDDDYYYANLVDPIPGANVDDDVDQTPASLEEEESFSQEPEECKEHLRIGKLPSITDLYISPPILNDMGGFTFHNDASNKASPASIVSSTEALTPRDANGNVIGFAMSKESPISARHQRAFIGSTASPLSCLHSQDNVELPHHGDANALGLYGLELEVPRHDPIQDYAAVGRHHNTFKSLEDGLNDDDMYFDDGMIDFGNDTEEVPEFDESVFDNDDTDQYGRPLPGLSTFPTLYSPPFVNTGSIAEPKAPKPTMSKRSSKEPPQLRLATTSLKSVSFEPKLVAEPSIVEDGPVFDPQVSLTYDTLSAYQSALAAAAHEAAENGRFRRNSNTTHDLNENDEYPPSQDDVEFQPYQSVDDLEDDGFDYDDALEDDDIIAEANAEALASDNDGFYGQEFGFYSAPATGEATYVNGGYFGSRDSDGLLRSKSGRSTREPNLTPITERSEYSNRNSLMSIPLSAHGFVTSPGLAQLAGMMGDFDDDNMSLSALLKARRGAWGGSQASVRSSNGEGSPLTAIDEDQAADHSLWSPSSGLAHLRRNSALSIGYGSETSSAPASPTLTLASMQKGSATGPPLPSPFLLRSLQNRPMSPKQTGAKGFVSSDNGERENAFGKQGRSHRHTGSADSISYIKEEDPIKGERWVLERRRTAETGETELLGRQVVSGGRI